MSAPMTKRERVTAAIRGEDLDRVPLSFFGHDYAKENAPEILAPYLVELGRKYDWDLVKVNLRMSCFQEAWDCRYRFDPERGPQMLDHVVKSIEDLKTLEKRDATKGVLGEQVRVVKLLSESLDSSVPRVQTVFTPLSVAGFLAGGTVFTPGETAAIRALMEEDPDALDQALSAISHTLADFARESVRAGADGIFMTTTSWLRGIASARKSTSDSRGPTTLPSTRPAASCGRFRGRAPAGSAGLPG